MAKKQPPETPPPDQSAKLPADVLRMARIVVAARGGSITKLLGDICRPELIRILQEMQDSGEIVRGP